MILASELRPGDVVSLDKMNFKVIESLVHAGGGRAGSMVHAKLRNLQTGAVLERRFGADEKLDDLAVDRVRMQYLYAEGEALTVMNPETFDQVAIQKAVIGPAARFLKENDVIEIEFHEGKPLAVRFPPVMELKVASTGAGSGAKGDTTLKQAVLENGVELLVPHFIKEGDRVHVDVETGKYLDRVMEKSKR